MALKSMTGFSRSDGAYNDVHWHWEIRSVNGRGLDLRVRLPSGYEMLEQKVREAASKRLARGNCSISLSTKRHAGQGQVRLNEEALSQAILAVQKVQSMVDAAPPTVDGLLSLKGVLELADAEDSEDEIKARNEAMLASFLTALDEMCAARGEEGGRLAQAISGQVDQLETLIKQIDEAPARKQAAIEARLKEQVERLFDVDNRLDPDRLHQEAVLIATKADIAEELDRLRGHISAARDLLNSDDPVGRRFDFLAQEFNREANTICSKSNDNLITRLGLEAKTVIDQMREQVQNIE